MHFSGDLHRCPFLPVRVTAAWHRLMFRMKDRDREADLRMAFQPVCGLATFTAVRPLTYPVGPGMSAEFSTARTTPETGLLPGISGILHLNSAAGSIVSEDMVPVRRASIGSGSRGTGSMPLSRILPFVRLS